MSDYAAILSRKFKNTEWTLNGDHYEGLVWLSKSTKPSKQELDSLWTEVQGEMKAEVKSQKDAKTALLFKLGITEEEALLLLNKGN